LGDREQEESVDSDQAIAMEKSEALHRYVTQHCETIGRAHWP
jgi:hypothetical protein